MKNFLGATVGVVIGLVLMATLMVAFDPSNMLVVEGKNIVTTVAQTAAVMALFASVLLAAAGLFLGKFIAAGLAAWFCQN